MASDKPNSENLDATIFYTSTPPMNANDPPNSSSEGVGSKNVSQPAIGYTGTTSGNAKASTKSSCVHCDAAMAENFARAPPNPEDKTPTTSNRLQMNEEVVNQPRRCIVMEMGDIGNESNSASLTTPSGSRRWCPTWSRTRATLS